MLNSYKKIKIQDLEPKKQTYQASKYKKKDLIKVLTQNSKQTSNKTDLYYADTGIADGERFILTDFKNFHQSNFFHAFLIAYMNHGDVVLTPDDVWIAIMFFVSKYFDTHAERLRSKLVNHEGTKSIKVEVVANSYQQSL